MSSQLHDLKKEFGDVSNSLMPTDDLSTFEKDITCSL